MSAEAAGTPPADENPDVLVAEPVIARLHGLASGDAAAVARAILQLPRGRSEPIRLSVPGDPPGTVYFALIPPGSREAPVVIYRESLRDESGKWLVTALMDRDAYSQYTHGLADNEFVQGLARVVAAGTMKIIQNALFVFSCTVRAG
jgi:hypothetical protein